MICHNCNDKFLAEWEVIEAFDEVNQTKAHGMSALDIGCGDSGDGERIFRNHIYTGVDQTTGTDARCLPFMDSSFFFVLIKRMLCQHGYPDRKTMIREARRVCKPGGRIIICEPWAEEYGNMNKLRVQSGLEPLPKPESGGNFLELREFLGLEALSDRAVATDYIYWTRYLYERLTGKMLAYDDTVRKAFPLVSSGADEFNYYRVRSFKNG
jgi:ubiquinone/menaquinone biosynthesis C-methylase UbiE